ncbi:TPA: salivaricin M family lantibiotic [Streptococcus agalactiae]
MVKNTNHPEIDSLEFEVENQELEGKSGSGWFTAIQLTAAGRCGRWFTAIQLTAAGRCGRWFTGSYECSSNNVKCG